MDAATKLNVFIICFWFVDALLGFSLAYEYLYRRDHRNFIFNRDVLEAQRMSVRTKIESELAKVNAALTYLNELLESLRARRFATLHESAPREVFLSSGRRYEFIFNPGMPPMLPTTSISSELNGKDEVLGSIFFGVGGFLDITERVKEQQDLRRVALEQRLASIPTDSPQIWSTLDFLYFSTAVQTTIGMGDILPNSTKVRTLVILQVLIGYALLVVGLGIVLSSHH